MPALNWIGKDNAINNYLDVPFRVLDLQYTFAAGHQGQPMSESENKIIRSDNQEALKTLMPRYEGKIKCIYIDPPYNTGNEGWVCNDNVNDPKFRKWLWQVVSRHDKWLCIMYPRLKLLQRLLAPDGAVFISIGDKKQANLKIICDEIFGATCCVSNISWRRTYSTRNDSKAIVNDVEHMAPRLIRLDDHAFYGDGGHTGLPKRLEIQEDAHLSTIDYQISTLNRYQMKTQAPEFDWDQYIVYQKSRVRSKVEYVFLITKRLFHYRKVRYRGFVENRTHAFTLAACANLFMLAQSGWHMGDCNA